MNLTKNFTLEEFQFSLTASRLRINNNIPAGLMVNVKKLADVLQVIRDAYKKPIIISSGYRSVQLNRVVGGCSNSDHRFASAADIHSVANTSAENKKLYDIIVKLAGEGRIEFRQLINEVSGDRDYSWLHISVNNTHNIYRKNQVLKCKV